MRKVKTFLSVFGRAFGPVILLFGTAITLLSSALRLLGREAMGEWTQDHLLAVGLSLFVVGVTAVVLRLEWSFRELDDFYGNEHKKGLWRDGINPTRHDYFHYLRTGDFATVNRFWNAGLVNLRDGSLRTDLHVSAEHGHSAIARGLIERGADPKLQDRDGRTPLMLAASRGHVKVAEVLLEHDCAMNATAADDGVSALYAAASNGHQEMVSTLIKAGAEIDRPDRDNITPIMAAIAQHKWEIARRLIEAGADLSRIDREGATLRDYVERDNTAPDDVVAKIVGRGVSFRTPRLTSTGSGHSGTGKVRVQWELADVVAERERKHHHP